MRVRREGERGFQGKAMEGMLYLLDSTKSLTDKRSFA